MFNKKLMIITIFFVSLLAVSVVSAADNITEDVVSIYKESNAHLNLMKGMMN